MRKILIILLLSSCVTQHQAEKYFNKHDKVASSYCSLYYPAKELPAKVNTRVVHDTTHIQGKTVVVNCDSQKGNVQVKCPDCDSYVDTVFVDSTKTIIDSAGIHSMRLECNKANTELTDALKSKKMWMRIAFAATGAFLGFKFIWQLIKLLWQLLKRVFGIFT